MAPMISGSKDIKDYQNFELNFNKEKKELFKLRKYIENNFEYVGKRF